MAIAWGEENLHTGATLLPFTLAEARRSAQVGALHNAIAGERFAHLLLDPMRANRRVPQATGALVLNTGRKLAELGPFEDPTVSRLGVEQSTSSTMIGRDLIVKVYRRLEPGPHPEVEIGRFLTDVGVFDEPAAAPGLARLGGRGR